MSLGYLQKGIMLVLNTRKPERPYTEMNTMGNVTITKMVPYSRSIDTGHQMTVRLSTLKSGNF